MEFYEGVGNRLSVNLHNGQRQAWNATSRFVVVCAGIQSGKTIFGPVWLWREIQQQGPGDYMVVTPTFPLLELKALPSFLQLFDTLLKLGKYVGSPVRQFRFSAAGCRRLWPDWNGETATVFFGHAQDPDSLESATAKAAWLDECGQRKFKSSAWDAIQRRLSIHQGRVLFTTALYYWGWFKQQIHDLAEQGHSDFSLIRFTSLDNPTFPREEYERQRRLLPGWKFRMFYQALFERPVGLIYDSFDEALHKRPRMPLSDDWERYLGLDFGGVNTVGLFYAKEPSTGRLWLYRTYQGSRRTAEDHVTELLRGEPGIPLAVGGAKSEDQWRDEFTAAGLPVLRPSVSSVELGINRVYGAHKEHKIVVLDDQDAYLDEKMAYAFKLNEEGEPTGEIEDKSSYHCMDAERYIVSYLIGDEEYQPSTLIGARDVLREADEWPF